MAGAPLDATFAALAHPVRRDMLVRLRRGPAQVTQLAAPYDLSLPSVSRHLDVLEAAGLISRTADGRERRCALQPGALDEALGWLSEHRRFWEGALDSLAMRLRELAAKERSRTPPTTRRGRGLAAKHPGRGRKGA